MNYSNRANQTFAKMAGSEVLPNAERTEDAPARDSPVLVGRANRHSRLKRMMLPPKEVVGGFILVDAVERG